jgi:hypothetical protein
MTAMRNSLAAVIVIVVLLAPAPARAWGFSAHRFIADRVIALLPPELRPLFERHRSALVERSIDPDLWRTAGFDVERPNHQLDIDFDAFGPYPFNELPRDRAAAVAKFGSDVIQQNGTLPWRAEEYFGRLKDAFADYGSRPNGASQANLLMFAPALTHYLSDAHVPFHAVVNYDGQLTQQHGIHSRFETGLFERYRDRLAIAPRAVAPLTGARDQAFDALIEGARLSKDVLKADLQAIGTRDVYDDAYFASFLTGARPVLERRLNESISISAAAIAGAWQAAGKPSVPVDLLQPAPAKRRR